MDDKEKTPLKLEDFIINITDNYPDPKALIAVLGVLIASEGNISTIGGKAKARKTFFICMLLAAYLTGEYYNIESNESKPFAILFDTEQGKQHVFKILKRIHLMCGFSLDTIQTNFMVFSLRELDQAQRVEIVSDAIRKLNPGFVVIDGIVDLCKDFNSIEESSKTVQLLMTLSSECKCHIASILHENKADGNLRGHLGSILAQKSETVLQLTKDGECTRVEGTFTRNIGFDDFHFLVDENGLPVVVDAPTKQDAQLANIKDNLKAILSGQKSMKYGELVESYQPISGIAEATAKRHIGKALKNKVINKDNAGYYRFNIDPD